jgi:hypothetical protein
VAKIALVTIGTDGFVDYVQTPDGLKFNLGPVSVLKLITGLVPVRTARAALKEFLENKQVLLSVDLDKMWKLLPFQRARYSSVYNPLMSNSSCRPVILREANMDPEKITKEAIEQQVAQIEKEISNLQASGMPKNMLASQVETLKGMIATMKAPSPYGDQSKNKTYYGLGKTASYDTFMANTEMAEDVITKVAATDETIDRLVSEGKHFDSARARMDLHKLASRVSEISQNVDLAYPWVSNDLMELSKKANEIHELFRPKG